MRNQIAGIILLSVAATSCKKEEKAPPATPPPVSPVMVTGRVQLLNVGEYLCRVDTNGTEIARVDKFSNKLLDFETGTYRFKATVIEGPQTGQEKTDTLVVKAKDFLYFIFP